MNRAFTLLLADESPTIRRMVELTFAGEPFSMIAVGGGAAAMEAIAAHPPDIVLADVALPPPDGYAIASFVKRTPALAHIPVILLTPVFQPVDATRAAGTGCDAVLAKPIDPPELEWKVKHLLRDPANDVVTDLSLADRFDAIDVGLAQDATPAGHPAASIALEPMSLDDYFDRIDDECQRPQHHELKRAFHALLDAARSQQRDRRRR